MLFLQFEAICFGSNRKRRNCSVHLIQRFVNELYQRSFFFGFELFQTPETGAVQHQPLNVKVHRARLMRNTGLCL